MPDLLLIGSVTAPMRARIDARFAVHQYGDVDLAQVGPLIEYVSTDGHLGVPAEVLQACPNLKLVASYGVGYDAIDTTACVQRGIVVTHTPDVLNAEVANTAILLMLALYREMLRDDAYVRSGDWATQGNAPLTRSPEGQRVGILGLGRIGSEIARKLSAFDARIAYHSRSAKDVPYAYYEDLIAMARDVDVLICITPGGAATHHLVNAQVIEALGPQGSLINLGRGSVVDEAALIAALQGGSLGWAGLDVFEDEPRVPEALCALSNVVLLPHVGSATVETRAAMGKLTVDNLISHLDNGQVISPVPECAQLAERSEGFLT